MSELLLARPVFLAAFGLLSAVYLLLKYRLARPRIRVEEVEGDESVRVLETSDDTDALAEALEELARTRDRRAVDGLGRLLRHPDARISAAAANVLGLIGDERALSYLFDSVGRLERELRTMGGESLPELTTAAADDEPGFGPAGPPEVAEDLVWPDREEGALQLAAHAKPGATEVSLVLSLIALATDPEGMDEYRYFALKNLELILPGSPVLAPAEPGRPRTAPAPEALARDVAMLLSDPSPSIRYAAVGALEVLRAADVPRFLEGAITDTNKHVRTRACLALAGIAPGKARKHLFALLSDPDEQVKRAAQRALDELDKPT